MERDLHIERVKLVAEHGEPKGPVEAAKFALMRGRGCGKTYEMIRALPDDGNAILIVSKLEHWSNWLKQAVLIQRPGYPVGKLRVAEHDNARVTTRGEPQLPTFVDNAVTDNMTIEYVEWFNQPRADAAPGQFKRIEG